MKQSPPRPSRFKNASPERQRQYYGMLCGGIGIGANLLLCALKILAGVLCGSVAVLADGVNNLSDAGSSALTLLGFRLAGKKPDRSHPFGHGRIEYLTGLAVSVIVILVGVELAKTSLGQLFSPSPVEGGILAIAVLLVAIPIKLCLYFVNRRIAKRIDSRALAASAADSLTDAAASGVTLASLLLGRFSDFPLDGLCGTALAALILVSGVRLALDTVNPLLGQAPDPEFVAKIKEIVANCPLVLGTHDLIVHDYGPGRRMVSLHAEVSSEADLMEAHDALDNLETRLTSELGCHAVIHMDPIVVNNEKINTMKQGLSELVREIDDAIHVHDIRIVEGPTHTNLVFDLVIPHSMDGQRAQIARRVELAIAERYPNHIAVMKIEHSFVGEETEGTK